MPSAMSTKARTPLCASIRENDCPFARRLAIEYGSDTPTMNMNAG